MQLDRDMLAKLIKEASDAHHEYEATLEAKDEQWPQWYADYILERFDEELSVADENAEAIPDEDLEE